MASSRLKVLFVFGTRPEAIKMGPLIRGMRAQARRFHPVVCVTGQHREMLRQVLEAFELVPDHDLKVMRPNQTLAGLSARVLERVTTVIARERPDVVLVQGDTTTAFAGALAAFYQHVPVAHVEAGLRTGDFENPFPEELNRTLVDRFARFSFAPTPANRRTLLREGVAAPQIHITGNTGIDALFFMTRRVRGLKPDHWPRLWGSAAAVIADRPHRLVLITAHRRESFGARFEAIFNSIRKLALRHPDWAFVYPVHLNPKVRTPAEQILAGLPNVHLIAPLPYDAFVFLMDRCSLILTDSGGIQEEAPSLGKPVVVMRETTERREALKAGTIILAGNHGRGLENVVSRLLSGVATGRKVRPRNPYGDGKATGRILSVLWKELRGT